MRPALSSAGDGPPRNYPVFKDLRGQLRAVRRRPAPDSIPAGISAVKSSRVSHFQSSSGPRVSRITPPLASARLERRVVRDLAAHVSGKQSGLNLQHPPVADTIVEQRVRHQSVHPLFVCP